MDDLSLSSDVQDSLDLFSDGDHKKKKKKKKDKKKKIRRRNQRNLENTRRRKKRPSHQRWQLENTRRRKKDLVIKDDNLWHASVKKIVKGKRTLSSCKLLGDAWFKFHILIICIYQLLCCCYLYRKPSISLLYWPYLGSIYQVYAMYIFMFFTKKTAPLKIRNQKNPLILLWFTYWKWWICPWLC